MSTNFVQSIGNLTISIIHPLINGGVPTTVKNLAMEGDLIDTVQLMMNSKIIALLGGDTISLTNTVKAGKMTINAKRGDGVIANGDLIAMCDLLQSLPDSQGGTVIINWSLNGASQLKTFFAVTHESHPPLKLAGNDLPNYPCTFNYGSFV